MATPTTITIPTEPIGSFPRPVDLIERIARSGGEDAGLEPLYEDAIQDTVEQFKATGSPVVAGGEQRKVSQFHDLLRAWTSEHGSGWFQDPVLRRTYAPPGAAHKRPVPLQAVLRLLPGCRHAYEHVPVKQAVISPSAFSLMYPAERIPDYSREQFIDDLLLGEHEPEIRRRLKEGAHTNS
jgi:5-methyltetrahydropteroyltriglutamate--homocysteine methyltransferase